MGNIDLDSIKMQEIIIEKDPIKGGYNMKQGYFGTAREYWDKIQAEKENGENIKDYLERRS
ncbi:MAG: hypothetical protein HOP31_01050 [Ignavibacteria bacterium]|nr:hypothetical protein [Ignavibacteria bacterium]